MFRMVLMILLVVSTLFAQNGSNKWMPINEDDEKIISLDTSSVKQIKSRVSVWAAVELKDPMFDSTWNAHVHKIRTKYLFNSVRERYSIIGELYFDTQGKIVGDLANTKLGGDSRFTLPVPKGTEVEIVYNGVMQYLGGNGKSVTDSEPTELAKVELPEVTPIPTPKPEPVPQQEDYVFDSVSSLPQEKEEVAPKEPDLPFARIYDPVSKKYIDLVDDKAPIEKPEPEVKKEVVPVSNSFDTAKEKFATPTIVTDGRLFCVQVSAWKNIKKADKEVNRLKKKGYEAFHVKAKPFKNKGTWYRVRVGYFSDLDEAKKVEKKIKKFYR